MDIHRPESIDEFVGNQDIVKLIVSRAQQRKLSHFIILVGDEGIGKTTLVNLVAQILDCSEISKPCGHCKTCTDIRDKLIRKDQNTQDVLKFSMPSEDKGVAKAKEIVSEMNANYIEGDNKVIIMEDIHSMGRAAQEILLSPLEYIPKDVYILATANSLNELMAKFLSRAVIYRMKHLDKKTTIALLEKEATRRRLDIQTPAILDIIATWSEGKARTALKALEAMGEDCVVSLDDIKAYTSYIDISKVIPIIDSFTGSPLIGMSECLKLQLDSESVKYLINILVAAIQIKYNQPVTSIALQDKLTIREAVKDLDANVLENFILEISRMPKVTNQSLLAAYLACHPHRQEVHKNSDNVLEKELKDKASVASEEELDTSDTMDRGFTTIESLIKNGAIQEDDD